MSAWHTIAAVQKRRLQCATQTGLDPGTIAGVQPVRQIATTMGFPERLDEHCADPKFGAKEFSQVHMNRFAAPPCPSRRVPPPAPLHPWPLQHGLEAETHWLHYLPRILHLACMLYGRVPAQHGCHAPITCCFAPLGPAGRCTNVPRGTLAPPPPCTIRQRCRHSFYFLLKPMPQSLPGGLRRAVLACG